MSVSKDVAAGLFFIALGALGLVLGWDYVFGTSARMGPGFVPKILCWFLIAIGVGVLAVGLLANSEVMERWSLRPLAAVLASVLVFAGLIETGGLVPATIGMVLTAAVGSTETRWLETVIVSVVLAGAAVLIFIKALGLTMNILPGQ
ncbi:MAG: tripartite tricarboxylate transporter TctB family protein [Bacteroidota bacterium]|nr:tripartite tricarboxylate transporter TctB family protein [Hyphomicrobiaceae bacterium]